MVNNLKETFRYSIIHPRYLAQHELLKIVSNEANQLHGKLLDVGCGKKPYAKLFSNVSEYIGLDLPSTMHGHSRVDVFATTLSLPIKDQCIDSVICIEVLEHTPDPLKALQEMCRVTKKGGILLVTVPLSEQIHEEPHDFFRFTHYGLQYLLEKSGWKINRVYTRGGIWLELGYRLSSFLYSSFGANQDTSGNLQPRLVLGPIIVFICMIIQVVALILDNIWNSNISTIGYGMLARKI